MELRDFFFSLATFELRYKDGYKVLDVPGEILKRWAAKFDPGFQWDTDGLKLQREADSLIFQVSVHRLSFTMTEVSTFDYFRDHISPIAQDLIELLDIKEPERAGARFHLIYPTTDTSVAANRIRNSGLKLPDEILNVLGSKVMGTSLSIRLAKGGIQRRLEFSAVERLKGSVGKGPESGILVDLDYSAHDNLTRLLVRSFMNEGFACLREQVLPLCDSIVRD